MGNQLVLACGAICGVVFGIGFLRGYGLVQMLQMSISLAASAVPEGLPAAATINFAMGITDLRRHGVLVRKLQAVETLGAVQTICLDKTGTITENRMTVTEILAGRKRYAVVNDLLGPCRGARCTRVGEIRHLLIVCALCNEIKITVDKESGAVDLFGSSTETASDAGGGCDRNRHRRPAGGFSLRGAAPAVGKPALHEQPALMSLGGLPLHLHQGQPARRPRPVRPRNGKGSGEGPHRGAPAGDPHRKRPHGRPRPAGFGLCLQPLHK
jgi:hypothetical protein